MLFYDVLELSKELWKPILTVCLT